MNNDVSLMDFSLDNVPDLAIAEEGRHIVKIISMQHKVSDAGNGYFPVAFAIIDTSEETKTVFYNFLGLPSEDDEKSQFTTKLRKFKDFCDAFNLNRGSMTEVMKEALSLPQGELLDKEFFKMFIKAEGEVTLGVQKNSETGELENVIKRFSVSKDVPIATSADDPDGVPF